MDEDWDVAGKTIMVTGATQGIGRETAAALAARGAKVIMAVRDVPRGQKVAEDIRQQHPGCDISVGPPLDLASLESVQSFAQAYRRHRRPLHALVNNAGALGLEPWYSPEGIAGTAQVNFLGPYALTRLLEDVLVESAPSRVVNVSSITHRLARVGGRRPAAAPSAPAKHAAGSSRRSSGDDPVEPATAEGGAGGSQAEGLAARVESGLRIWKRSTYPATKLMNVLFAYELQRRLGPHGVQSCAVDPGGVASNVWHSSPYERPPLSWVIGNLFAPPSDGASAVVHACVVPWGQDRAAARRATLAATRGEWRGGDAADLRFYARGMFTSPLVTRVDAAAGGLTRAAWGLSAIAHSLLDWPLRRLTGNRLAAQTAAVPSSPVSYDPEVAAALWDAAADVAGVPRAVKLRS